MPWRESVPMDERVQFIGDWLRQRESLATVCRRYGISRKTGYKWIARYDADRERGLEERSSRPHSSPQATERPVVAAIVRVRKRYPSWGGKKILSVLGEQEPTWTLPAVSTANDILKRAGLVEPRRRRRPVRPAADWRAPAVEPNSVWTADFKGQFRTLDGELCYPLTMCDAWSRFLLRCHGLASPTTAGAASVFHRAFQEYGLPQRIRTDNGEPFAAASLGRLSRLSVWWVRLGIYPELIPPSSPQENGSHERMHRTLKAETTRPPAATRRAQQGRFTRYRRHYNEIRPHEALGQRAPARLYQASSRALPRRLEPLVYPAHFEIRCVSKPGVISWHSKPLVISTVLIHQEIALEPIDDGEWDLHFGPIRLGRFDERTRRIHPASRHR